MNEIVAACPFRDTVLIFTRNGDVYMMSYEPIAMHITFNLIHRMFIQ